MSFPARERDTYSVLLKTTVLSIVGTKDGAVANAERIEVELAARIHANVLEASEVAIPQTKLARHIVPNCCTGRFVEWRDDLSRARF